ncbi:E3 ubiquitin-protein ligase MARCHF3 isoform X2 [Drosophila kikkawai]|nr:E3 ubiquitin-protein ligase MARCHF3 isoform X2 [Drosophila kikkawai]
MSESQPDPETQPQNVLSEASTIRLLSDVAAVATHSCSPEMGAGSTQSPALDRMLPPITRNLSQEESIHSANENGHSCRICRWNRSDMEIIKCPCTCKGSVGFIHMKCLKRWIMHKQSNRCEICHAVFDISEDRASLKQMVKTFCCHRCCGLIVKHLLFSASLMPLANIILQQ